MHGVFDHHLVYGENFSRRALDNFKKIFPKFSDKIKLNKEIVYQNLPEFEKYKDSTVLMVGGGPSTNELDLDSIEYDYIWSINHFYRNPKLKDVKVDLAMIMGEPDITAEDFLEYREKHQPFIGFEIHERWMGYEFDDYERYFCMHTRFYGRVGGGARMKMFAAQLGCKNVIFTGFDGPEAILKGDHAFEPGKKTLPSIFKGKDSEVVSSIWTIQYDYFWNYVQNLYPNTKFKNIGGGEKYHEGIK